MYVTLRSVKNLIVRLPQQANRLKNMNNKVIEGNLL